MEEWKPILGFEEAYEVSNQGRVRSYMPGCKCCTSPAILKPHRYGGYQRVRLFRRNGGAIRAFVHRLVAQAFIPNPFNLPFVNHKNGTPGDDVVSNLEWITPGDNVRHAWRLGLHSSRKDYARGDEHGKSKLTTEDVLQIRRAANEPRRQVARRFNVAPSTIRAILKRETWAHLP